MLALKLGPSTFSRHVLAVPARVARRLYADDTSGRRKNVFEELLGAARAPASLTPPAQLDPESNPFAKRIDSADRAALNDILSYQQPPPESTLARPRALKPKPAPLATAVPVELAPPSAPTYTLPQRPARDDALTADDAPPVGPIGTGMASEDANKKAGSIFSPKQLLPSRVLYRLYVTARPRNCLMTLVDEHAHLRASVSSGQCGFRNAAEGSYEAGYQCAVRIFDRVRAELEARREEIKIEIFLNGFGQGRGALLKALSMSEGDGVRDAVWRLTDKTPIKIGGVRLQKRRRL